MNVIDNYGNFMFEAYANGRQFSQDLKYDAKAVYFSFNDLVSYSGSYFFDSEILVIME